MVIEGSWREGGWRGVVGGREVVGERGRWLEGSG